MRQSTSPLQNKTAACSQVHRATKRFLSSRQRSDLRPRKTPPLDTPIGTIAGIVPGSSLYILMISIYRKVAIIISVSILFSCHSLSDSEIRNSGVFYIYYIWCYCEYNVYIKVYSVLQNLVYCACSKRYGWYCCIHL